MLRSCVILAAAAAVASATETPSALPGAWGLRPAGSALSALSFALAGLAATAPGARAAVDDCVAGGAGRATYFDWRRYDVISLQWDDLPIEGFTWECWTKMIDTHITNQQILAYSAYNVNGKLGETPGTPYEQANELTFGYTPSMIRYFRATDPYDCKQTSNAACDYYDEEWVHQALTWNMTTGEFGFFKNGEALDLDYSELYVDPASTSQVDAADSLAHSRVWGTDFDFGLVAYDAFVPSDPCAAGSYAGGASGKLAVLDRESGDCTDEERYAEALDDGASAVVFVTTTDLEAGDDAFDTSVTPASTVPTALVTDVDVSGGVTDVVFFRSRLRKSLGGDMQEPVEPGGVLTLSAEPDAPWASFDEYQAADAMVDELRVWHKCRTEDEIREWYNRSVPTDHEDLHLYWKFDDDEDASDLTGNGNDGLVGALPTIKNEMQWQTDRAKGEPTTPVWYPSAAPVVSQGAPVVVQARGGVDLTIALSSYDPDGTDLVTKVTSVPDEGALVTFEDTGVSISAGDTVTDSARSASKRVVFQPPAGGLTQTVSFDYSVNDGGSDVAGSVTIEPFAMLTPVNWTMEIDEDEMDYVVIGQPGNDNDLYEVSIAQLPGRGQLYQPLFTDGSQTYLSVILDPEDDGQVPITAADTVVDSARGIVFYLPEADEFSDDGEVYTTFAYYYTDVATGETSDWGYVHVYVGAVNDAPLPGDAALSVAAGETSASVQLTSTDVDDDAPAHFAEKAFMKIVEFPSIGELAQQDGTLLDSTVERVPIVSAYISNVHRWSSQYSLCSSCFAFKNPICEWDLGTCSDPAWSHAALIGEPDVYPEYVDSKLGFDFASEDYGDEWLELQFPYQLYFTSLTMYEVHKPGATVKISATPDYVDDTSVYCDDTGVENDAPVPCSMDSEWTTLWTTEDRVAPTLKEEARAFTPPLCPATFASDTVRLWMDTSAEGAPGWSNTDAVMAQGSLEFPPGLISDTDNYITYIPTPGVHGDSLTSFQYSASDCLDESTDYGTVTVSVAEPAAEFDTPFSVHVVIADAGAATDMTLDLSDVVAVAADAEDGDDVEVVVHAAKPDGLEYELTGAASGAVGSYDELALTTTPSGAAATNAIELWVTVDGAVTVRKHVVLCRTGYTYVEASAECEPCSTIDTSQLSGDDSTRYFASCSLDERFVEFDSNAGVLLVPTLLAVLALVEVVAFMGYTFIHRGTKVFRFAQVKFCFVILFGALLACLSALLFAVEKTDAVCASQMWLGHLAYGLIMGALFAKTYRVHRLLNNKKLKKVIIKDSQLFVMVGAVTAGVAVILLLGMAVSPVEAQWVVSDQTEVIDFVEHRVMYLWCQAGDDPAEPDRALSQTLLVLEGLFLLVGCYLSFVTRNTGDAVNESKYIAVCIYNLFFTGLIITGLVFALDLDPDVSSLLQGVGVAFGTIVCVSVLFLPKIWAVHHKIDLDIYASTANNTVGTQGTTANGGVTTSTASAGGDVEAKLAIDKERQENRRLQKRIKELEERVAELQSVISSPLSTPATRVGDALPPVVGSPNTGNRPVDSPGGRSPGGGAAAASESKE